MKRSMKHGLIVAVVATSGFACSNGDGSQGNPSAGGGTGGFGGAGGSAGAGGIGGNGGGPMAGNGGTSGAGPVAGTGGGGAGGQAGTPAKMDAGMNDAGAMNGSGDAGVTPPADGGNQTPTCPATSSLEPGETTRTLQVDGTTREYLLHVPPAYTGETPVPLVLDWHGLYLDPQSQRDGSGYAEVADREGFIVAYPAGIDNAWNIGPCCTESREVDDVGFALAIVEELKSLGCIDPKRVYSTGFSNGGGMSHYLACEATDTFAAVAPSAFDLLEENDCDPSRPITVISFRGTNDLIVPYEGGESTPPTLYPLDPIHFEGAEDTFQRWAEINECQGSPEASGDGCETYSQCADGVEVTLCTNEGGGHEPGDAERGWSTLSQYTLP